MTFIYLVVMLIITMTKTSPQVIEGVNTIFETSMVGTEMFWWGLLAAFILDLIWRNK